MRGGLERWKRGVGSSGVRQALAYAFQGSCDSHLRSAAGVDALAGYSAVDERGVTRFTVDDGVISTDLLGDVELRRWVDGCDPATGERRGRELVSPDSDLILDGTINAPKSFSIAALLSPDLAAEFDALQDRLRNRIITMWQRELNARRGAGGRFREELARVEVVELKHRRSRALDPHIHRHLWLSVKVLGRDGKWSNVDSRVAMKMHTVINAEGDLAARTDPVWVAALARHGFTLDAEGEIAELAHAVRPLSRRSTQIEANRAMLFARWRSEHPGLEPSPDQVQQIDRLAWAKARPNKPGEVDEAAWEQLVVEELTAVDPRILLPRRAVETRVAHIGDLDRGLLAAKAIVEADDRAAGCGGRFSLFDLRGGVIRAVAASGVVAPRELLDELIEDVTARALEHTLDLLATDGGRPAHVKGYMAAATAALKVDLAAAFDALADSGESVDRVGIAAVAADVLGEEVVLDDRQLRAAAAIAGTDRLVSITGPAGAGKTTMLRVARGALANRDGRMVVVAPTKKAAAVAGREIGASASSLHAFLADHGWRWARDPSGMERWSHLRPGDADPVTGIPYPGPRRSAVGRGDRIVVDEAGMVDLHTAHALAMVATETGAGIAMVGDPLQARPVGHSGAMASLTRRATAVVELTAVHRFRDPEYAALTLRMRDPESADAAKAVARDLDERGLIRRVDDSFEAHNAMVEAYFQWSRQRFRVAVVTSSNEEADAVNAAIQERRLAEAQLSLKRIAVGNGEQRLLEGDTVQTRRNDHRADVENRAVWTIRHITAEGLQLVSADDDRDTRTVSLKYAAEHVHLAYATTVHGIQGETTDISIVGPGVDAAGLYVGMTRGREHNEAVAISHTDAGAREQVARSMLRGATEVTIDDSIRAARQELSRAARDPGDAAGGDVSTLRRGEVSPWRTSLLREHAWLTATKQQLLDLDADVSSGAARAHARTHPTGDPTLRLTAQRDALAGEYTRRLGNYTATVREIPARDAERRDAATRNSQHVDPSSGQPIERPRVGAGAGLGR